MLRLFFEGLLILRCELIYLKKPHYYRHHPPRSAERFECVSLARLRRLPPRAPSTVKPPRGGLNTTKTRRPSPGPRKTYDLSLFTAGASLPFAYLSSLPNGTSVSTFTPLEGITRTH